MSEEHNHNTNTRTTRIIGTIGPACRSVEIIERMQRAGLDMARLHFSYGDRPEHLENIRRLRDSSRTTGRPLGILQDLSGTKARMLNFGREHLRLSEGSQFTLTGRAIEGDKRGVSVSVPELLTVAEPGDRVLLADGALILEVVSKSDADLHCTVLEGGIIKEQQAVHVPGKTPPVRVPTKKDLDDVTFAIEQGIDWIALSYLSDAGEVHDLRDHIRRLGDDTPIVAKIERREALENLDAIIDAADAVMVARGDLGIEIPIEEIALVQKDIIRRAVDAGKPAITATEMLTSMMEQSRPRRAEVSDITNAILDGSAAVMLSGETAMGKHPVEAVRVMARIAAVTDSRSPSLATPDFPITRKGNGLRGDRRR